MSSQWGSQKLLQGLVSHELTAYLSIFNIFKLNELRPYYQSHANQIILNCTSLLSLALWIFEAFIWILLIENLSLNHTLLTFLLYARQTWMTELILTILSGRLPSFNPKEFQYSYAWTCSLCEERTSSSMELIYRKVRRFLLTFSIGFISLSVLLLFLLLITFFVFVLGFWFCFI